MNVYVDHNFLLYCIKEPSWGNAAIKAHQQGAIALVLSPWHFYECAKGMHHSDGAELIEFAEELQPAWILARGDLQLFEFWVVWGQLWEQSKDQIRPIGTLQEIVAILCRVNNLQAVAAATVREFIESFAQSSHIEEFRMALDDLGKQAASNSDFYHQRSFDAAFRRDLKMNHLALQFAQLELQSNDPGPVFSRAAQLLNNGLMRTKMECFIEWGFIHHLKSYQTESALTEELYASRGSLGPNRFVDRQHASVALPYCDAFVTDDQDLIKRCARVREKLRFGLARVTTGKAFVDSL